MGAKEHKKHRYSLKVGVITVSSTRDVNSDESGKILLNYVEENGHNICDYTVVKDSKLDILESLFSMLKKCDAVIVNGGTGISPYDVTYDSIVPAFDKKLDGFGELFRMISYEEVGTAAILSRATAGIIGGKLIFLVPGSPNAVKTASKIIFSEINHMWYEIHKE